jgi:hypothetical protein
VANRSFIDSNFSLVKRMVHLFGCVSAAEGATTVILKKWNYPTLGAGTLARTYSAAATASALPSGAAPYPLQYAAGSEGIRSVTRTATGKWTVTLQDNYQRMVGLNFYEANAGGVSTVVKLCEDTTLTNMAAAGGSVIGLKFSSAAGAAADPIGDVRLELILQDATEP